jgi:hypothetical protein
MADSCLLCELLGDTRHEAMVPEGMVMRFAERFSELPFMMVVKAVVYLSFDVGASR